MADGDNVGSQPETVHKQQTGIDIEHTLFSGTLKRNPKMDMNKTDLLQLLSYLEGELQARDVAIASLKMDQVKQMLSRAKYGWSDMSDPVSALQRDSEVVNDMESDDAAIRGIYGNQLLQLERLIATQRTAQQQMRDQLVAVEKQYHRTCAELDDVKRSHAGEIELAENVTCLLEKDRDRYKQEAEYHRARCKQLDCDLKSVTENHDEDQNVVARHRQVALMLLRERSRLVLKLLEARERSTELEQTLKEEHERSSTLEESLERQVAECEQLCSRLASAESLNRTLQLELDGLRSAAAKSPAATAETQSIVAAASNSVRQAKSQQHQSRSASGTGLDSRRAHNSPRNPTTENTGTVVRNAVAGNHVDGSNDKWATPMNRNIAAARLRSVLSAAIDGSSGPSSAVETGSSRHFVNQSLPSAYQQQQQPASVLRAESHGPQMATKLPQMSSSMSASYPGSHSVQRSVVLPPAGGPGLAVHAQPSPDSKSTGRLTPLLPVSPRLAPLMVPPSQTNGAAAGVSTGSSNFVLKPFHGNSK